MPRPDKMSQDTRISYPLYPNSVDTYDTCINMILYAVIHDDTRAVRSGAGS